MHTFLIRNFSREKNNFEISRSAIRINRKMPEFTFKIVERLLKNKKNPKVAVFGITYKEDVGDMRFSPSKILIEKMEKKILRSMYLTRLLKNYQ